MSCSANGSAATRPSRPSSRARAQVVDEVILASWIHFAAKVLDSADLVAVGGYGRGELHPQSDIDLLILLENASNNDR